MATAVVRGEGQVVDYTPGADVDAGDVVVQESLVGVATRDITDSVLGALLVKGLVDFPKDTGSGDAISAGVQLYWDAGNEVATATADSNKKLGVSAVAAAASASTVRVLLGHHVA